MEHGNVRLRLIVRQIVRLSVRLRVGLRRVHKAGSVWNKLKYLKCGT